MPASDACSAAAIVRRLADARVALEQQHAAVAVADGRDRFADRGQLKPAFQQLRCRSRPRHPHEC
jgi:hypothetical protein